MSAFTSSSNNNSASGNTDMDTGTPTGGQDSGQAFNLFASPPATANRFAPSHAGGGAFGSGTPSASTTAAAVQYPGLNGMPQQHGRGSAPSHAGGVAFGGHGTSTTAAAAGFQFHGLNGMSQQHGRGAAPTFGGGGVAYGGGGLFGSPPPPPSPAVSIANGAITYGPNAWGMAYAPTALQQQQQRPPPLHSTPFLASTNKTAADSAMGLLYLDELMDDDQRARMLTELSNSHGPTSEIGKKVSSGHEVLKKKLEDTQKALVCCDNELAELIRVCNDVVRQKYDQKTRIQEELKDLKKKAEFEGPLNFCLEAHLHPITHQYATKESLRWMMKHAPLMMVFQTCGAVAQATPTMVSVLGLGRSFVSRRLRTRGRLRTTTF